MNEIFESPPPEIHSLFPPVTADPAPDDDPDLLAAQNADIDVLTDAAAVEARAWAERVRAIDRMRCRSIAMVAARPRADEPRAWTVQVIARRELQFEIAAALRLPWPTAARLIEQAELLTTDLPRTLGALDGGVIGWGHATVLADQSLSVPDDARADFEQRLLPLAATLTVPQFRDAARKLRESLHPDSVQQRRDDAFTRRNVRVTPDLDGMATLTATIAAEAAIGIDHRLTAIAAGHDLPHDERTIGQRKTDVLTDLLLTGDTFRTPDGVVHAVDGVEAKVLVTVPVETLMGTGDAPGNLEGYGPIAPDTARELAAKAPSFTRLLVHPVSSAILDFDRSRYAVPADLKLVLRVRDETCRIVGCRQPAAHCDVDHTIPFGDGSNGTTCVGNLAHLCEAHHNLKHHTGIRMRNLGDGTIEWTSAAGRTYLTRPAGDVSTMTARGATPPAPPQRAWDTKELLQPTPF
jgi:hypothetical protein